MSELQILEVDLDVLGQVAGQTPDFDVVHHVLHYAAAYLHTRTDVGIDEMQGHLHMDLPVLVDALEIGVQRNRLPRMHLELAQQHLFLGAVDCHIEDRGVKSLELEVPQQRVLVEFYRLHRLVRPVDDAGDLPAETQAARRKRRLRQSST